MEKYLSSWKVKLALAGIYFLFAFVLGHLASPGINLTWEIVSAVIGPKKTEFVRPISEYEKLTDELWKSEKHQATCKANAAATVSLQLVQKYLNETKKQQLMAEYEIPQSLIDDLKKNEVARKAGLVE